MTDDMNKILDLVAELVCEGHDVTYSITRDKVTCVWTMQIVGSNGNPLTHRGMSLHATSHSRTKVIELLSNLC